MYSIVLDTEYNPPAKRHCGYKQLDKHKLNALVERILTEKCLCNSQTDTIVSFENVEFSTKSRAHLTVVQGMQKIELQIKASKHADFDIWKLSDSKLFASGIKV
jgi:hypothetical protein